MNDYIGKICPYCKTGFSPCDDIIVCSECDMPHHKDCWVENQGCTTFGCLGTIKSADNTVSSVTATQMTYDDPRSAATPANSGVVFCTRCGTQNANTSFFCFHCGSRLTAVPERALHSPVFTQADPNNRNPYSYGNQPSSPYRAHNQYQTTGVDTDVLQLVGVKPEYYIPRFQMLKSEGRSASWNWAAFLVTPYWMMYRKMYAYAAAVLAADIIIALIGSAFLSLLAFGGYIVFGILGNTIYMKYLESKATLAKAMREPYKSQFIASNGGVNTTATVLAMIGRALVVGILLR